MSGSEGSNSSINRRGLFIRNAILKSNESSPTDTDKNKRFRQIKQKKSPKKRSQK